ncbi:GIP [Symbiodinium sp. CCMP2592]|nr:GIP [Symbiodinium sp. CCMP2592]
MIVPTFSGAMNSGEDDLGSSARSYLRQVSAWRRMTRMSKDQQGLTLYQHLTDRAWIDAERLDMDRLGSPEGVDYLISWIKDRYLDVQVTQVGRSLSDFFRRLRKRDGQPMREYMADFDRAHARLAEVGCELPDIAAAWVFVDRMCLEESAELNLLASVNNNYSLKPLQQAAIVHDRGLRKPWESQNRGPRREWGGKKPHSANMADPEVFLEDSHDEHLGEQVSDEGEAVSEEIAENLYNAYMTHETAKQRYRENSKLRGSDPEALRRLASEKLRLAKSRSFCSGCRRRGHWHRDAECPLNKGSATSTMTVPSSGQGTGNAGGTARDPVKANFPCHVVHVTWDLGGDEAEKLLAITDTACSKSVAGAAWVDNYVEEAKRRGCEPQFMSCREAFRFGASKVFVAGYSVAICFSLGKFKVILKVAVVNGEVPLLVSRPALGHLGMVMDVAENTATFKKLGVVDMGLRVTDTGHPAFPIEPVPLPRSYQPLSNGEGPELQIFPSECQYTEGQYKLCHARRIGCFLKFMEHGVMTVITPLSRCCGLAEQCFVDGDPCPNFPHRLPRLIMSAHSELLTAPVVTRQKTLWELTKSELITEARARGLWFHESWTAVELRSLIQENRRAAPSKQSPLKGLSGLKVEDLKEKAMELGYKLPPHATRGTILRILRDQDGMCGESLMTFGRFSGKKFSETPTSYREWAVREVSSHDNPSEELVLFANWWQAERLRSEQEASLPRPGSSSRPGSYVDPETNARTPYVEDTTSMGSWDEVSIRTSPIREGYGARPKAKAAAPTRTPAARRTATAAMGPEKVSMEQDVPGEVIDEVLDLEARLVKEIFYECEDVPAETGTEVSEEALRKDLNDQAGEIDDYFNCDLDLVYQAADGGPVSSMNSGGCGDVIQRKPPEVNSVFAAPDVTEMCEKTAKEKLALKKFTYDDLIEIARLLPLRKVHGKKGSRRGGGNPYQYFLGGMYTYGKFFGIARGSKALPWTTRYINSFAKEKFDGAWTSFVLFRDTETQVHADVHNLPGTSVTTVSFGDFTGGELWVKNNEGIGKVLRDGPDGSRLHGDLVCTKECPHTFDGKVPHATQPWDGERWALSCFTTRGFGRADTLLRDELRDLRFPLRGLPRVTTGGDPIPETHHVPRPKKSVRKGLWKTSSRLATLTTWCTTAASLCLTEDFPLSRGPEAVTLFEIGGISKTIDIAERDYITVEPYEYDLAVPLEENISYVDRTFNGFAPSMLWVHGEQPLEFLSGLVPTFHKQVNQGRKLAFEAADGHPFWDSPPLRELLEKHTGRYGRRPGESGILRFNDLSPPLSLKDEHRDVPEFTNYVCHPDLRGHNLESDHYEEDPGPREPLSAEPPGLEAVLVVDQEQPGGPREPLSAEPRGAEAIHFDKGRTIAPEVRSSLKRLHQNMGHPSNLDLARHLRLAGADATVVEACKRLRCQVCHRNQRGASAKPATLPNLLEFNQLVAVDAFYVCDCDGEKVELMIVVDVGTGFVSAGLLQGHSGITMESSFCSIWSNTFGAPGTMVVDLESGLQAGLGRFGEWHGTKIRPVAGQAHWQNGTAERAIRTWKEIWGRLVDEWSASSEEAGMIITAASTAMNTLRRDAGFSPSQAVWGRDPKLPEELKGTPQDEHVEHIISHDRQRAREHSLRISAKEAYFRVQNDARLRRSLLQRSRVAGPDLQQGAHVFFYRKPKNNKNWEWHGPGVVIGKEGPNAWVSFSGRCHLVAPEHLRLASGEELGAAFAMRATQEDLQKLLEQDFADEDMYEGEDMELTEDHVLLPEGPDSPDQEPRGEPVRRPPEGSTPAPVTKRHRTKGPPAGADEAPQHQAFMMKLPKTQRGREKALEKELPWSMIPPEQHEAFKQAENKQWEEHVEHQALEPLSIEESRKIIREKGDRVLGSRFAYRDKLWSRRRQDPTLGWKAKARLVIAGHRDPDLMDGLSTHAPTISRQGILLLLQILASNLSNDWGGYAGDVTAAFLCGGELERELYLRQPRTGLGSLHPEQLLKIKKPIFGLVDSPAAWWTKFKGTMKSLVVDCDGKRYKLVQSSLDHCIFMVQEIVANEGQDDEILGTPEAYLGVHVDDVLLVGKRALCEVLKKAISERFPIRDWEADSFDYVGSLIDIQKDKVKISQASYAMTRLFEIEVEKDVPDHFEATETQKHDNMSLIGALSWMASQTRPDLQVGVSMSQQRQKEPTVGDIRFTNQMARRALEHHENGLELYPVDLDNAVLLCFHDAGWANVPQSQDDPYYSLTAEEDEAGLITDGPFARKEAKAKKASSSITSQLGGIYLLADKGVLHGKPARGSILDWRSGACDRVCRSTFAAETMACCTATETGDYIGRFLETLLTGKLERRKSRFHVRFLTDCRSLYDHLTRDGVPRVPSCKRLAIDLAGIREDILNYGKIVWVPTWAQLADVLTKPLKADQWWKTIQGELKLTFREREDCIDKRQNGTSVKLEGS